MSPLNTYYPTSNSGGCSTEICRLFAQLNPAETKNQYYRTSSLRYYVLRRWRVEIYTWTAWKYSWASSVLSYPVDTATEKTLVQLGTLSTNQSYVLGAIRARIRELVPSSPDFKCNVGPASPTSLAYIDDLDYESIYTFYASRNAAMEDWPPGWPHLAGNAGFVHPNIAPNVNTEIILRTDDDWRVNWAAGSSNQPSVFNYKHGQGMVDEGKTDTLFYFNQMDHSTLPDRFDSNFISRITSLIPWYNPSSMPSDWQNQPYTHSSDVGYVVGSADNPAQLVSTWHLPETDQWQKVAHTPVVQMSWEGISKPYLNGECCCDQMYNNPSSLDEIVDEVTSL